MNTKINTLFTDLIKELDLFISKIPSKEKSFELKGGREVVSEYDLNLETILTNKIYLIFPDHNIIAEEASYKKTNSPYTWYIDPIDNTVGFLSGEPEVVTSISLKKNSEYSESLIYKWDDRSSFRSNDFSASVSTDELNHRSKGISTCVYISTKHFKTAQGFYTSLWEERLGLRMSGSAAHDLLLVAQRKRYAHVSFAAHPWDIEAGLHLVKQSGGYIEILKEFSEMNCIAFIAGVNKKVVDELKQMIIW